MIYSGNAIIVQMLADGIAEFRFDFKHDSPLDTEQLQEFKSAIQAVKSIAQLQGLLVTTTKPNHYLNSALPSYLKKQETWLNEIQETLSHFENLHIPKAVVLNGHLIGHHFEFCLMCDYRVASPQTMVTLPDLQFGLTPSWGASVRLPRLIGIEHAIDYLTTRQRISANELFKHQLIDSLVCENDLKAAAIHTLKLAISGKLNWQTQRQQQQEAVYISDLAKISILRKKRAQLYQDRLMNHYPAYKYLLDGLSISMSQPFTEAKKTEQNVFLKALHTPHAHAQIQLFLNNQTLKNHLKKAKRHQHPIQKLVILGDTPTAHQFIDATLTQNIQTYLQQPQDTDFLTLYQQHQHHEKSIDYFKAMPTYDKINEFDLVFDTDLLAVQRKQNLEDFEKLCHRHTIFMVQIKKSPLNVVTAHLKRQENIIGLHFIDETHKTVELIKTPQTSDVTFFTTYHLLQKLGKQIYVTQNLPVIHRLAQAFSNAYSLLLQHGITSEQIEEVLHQLGWNAPLMQWANRFSLYCTIPEKMPQPRLKQTDILDILLLSFVNEMLHCLQEKYIQSIEEADILATQQFKFPEFMGGVMQYIDHIGHTQYQALCEKYASCDSHYNTPLYLKKAIEKNTLFYATEVYK